MEQLSIAACRNLWGEEIRDSDVVNEDEYEGRRGYGISSYEINQRRCFIASEVAACIPVSISLSIYLHITSSDAAAEQYSVTIISGVV